MSFFDEEDFDVEGYLNDEHDGHYESSDESDTLSGSELSSESYVQAICHSTDHT
eukprot:m.143795 g.143795  ORF g.143795 m.143795 type:complete len:54 (-) comp30335_c0_seq1:6-167(-)